MITIAEASALLGGTECTITQLLALYEALGSPTRDKTLCDYTSDEIVFAVDKALGAIPARQPTRRDSIPIDLRRALEALIEAAMHVRDALDASLEDEGPQP